MGEAWLANELAKMGRGDVLVSSAGLSALVGRPAEPDAQTVMQREGIDISSHRARQLTRDLVTAADLVLVMEMGHRRVVEMIDPTARGKVFRLGEWSQADVPDPYQDSEEFFQHVLQLIKQFAGEWLPKLT
jgi:protein-tyrosine phosphatase